jgi:selenophosphate synthase
LNDREATSRAGFDMHLTKPVGIDAIRQVLAGLPLIKHILEADAHTV